MYKTRVNEATDGGKMQFCYVEMDPSERYGRFKDVLGRGAMKTVYRAFDEFLGIEVAWNQVKMDDVFRSPDELQRLYSEVHLLKTLNHESIMKFRAYWIDVDRRTFNFITEMFTSGTLREYRKKYARVNIRAIKDWASQILKGLDYLHTHNPPVIHRDLKCDNIFVNGHLGQVKIGDLGLAAILSGSHHAHSVIGTPEFMAPELYEEDYDELVDIYSFGMCVLEMLTSEYPYCECSNPAQIYKKVTSGKLPESFYRIEDVEAQRFVKRCLEKVALRPSARELLMDPFLSVKEKDLSAIKKTKSSPQMPALGERYHALQPPLCFHDKTRDMTITGTMDPEDDTIFLKVQISNKDGPADNIYFPFDITSDTPLDVATEMVKEFDITDWRPSEIADMIDEEISTFVPCWKGSASFPIQQQQQHSFNYADHEDDNDDNTIHHPFYYTSSFSSSKASLPGLDSLHEARMCQGNSLSHWLQEEARDHDDASSQSSSCSDKYYNVNYSSKNDDEDIIPSSHKEPVHNSKTKKCTRFGPEGSVLNNCKNYNNVGCISKQEQRMVRSGSLVDIRSQLLHRSLVEEINKRRLFNTVGAVEHIGYHEPCDYSGGQTFGGFSPGNSKRESSRKGSKS